MAASLPVAHLDVELDSASNANQCYVEINGQRVAQFPITSAKLSFSAKSQLSVVTLGTYRASIKSKGIQ